MRSLMMWAALPLVSMSVLGCATSSDATDELAGETTGDDAIAGKADASVDGAYSYFQMTADLRKCASPVCGGSFLKRLNRSTTICHDGQASAACYVPVLDWSEANLADASHTKLLDASKRDAAGDGVYTIVRGRFAPTNTTVRPELGRFVVTEAWVAAADTVADGVFVKVKQSGVRCIAAPCEDKIERALNTSRSAQIAELDFSLAAMTDGQVETANQAILDPGGVLLAGNRYTVHENGRTAKGRTATCVYQRIVDAAAE